jgi:hypothetical protein
MQTVCPHCNQKQASAHPHAGEKVKCLYCHKVFTAERKVPQKPAK